MTDELRMISCDPHRDGGSHVVSDDDRLADTHEKQEIMQALRVCGDSHAPVMRRVGAAVPEKIKNENPVAFREAREIVLPQMGRQEDSMNHDNRIARSPISEGIAIESGSIQVDELTSHASSLMGETKRGHRPETG